MRASEWLGVVLCVGLMGTACEQLGLSKDDAKSDEKADKDDKDDKDKDDDDEDDGDSKKKKKKDKDKDDKDGDEDAKDIHAFQHLPSDCDIVVTLDVKSVLSQKAVKSEIVPLIDDAIKKESADEDFKDFQAFLKDAKIDPKKSVTDMAVCVRGLPDNPKFGVALAGDFKKETIVKAMEKHLDADDKKNLTEIDGRKAISDEKLTLGQAANGSVVFGDDRSLFEAMGKETQNFKSKYKLATDKDLAFSVPDGLAQRLAKPGSGTPKEFETIKDVVGSFDLSSRKAIVTLETGSAGEAEKLNALLVLMKGEFEKDLAGRNEFGEGDVLKGAKSRQDGKNVIIEVSLPADALDKSVAALAKEMKSGLGGI